MLITALIEMAVFIWQIYRMISDSETLCERETLVQKFELDCEFGLILVTVFNLALLMLYFYVWAVAYEHNVRG
jgi:hypothetical protein